MKKIKWVKVVDSLKCGGRKYDWVGDFVESLMVIRKKRYIVSSSSVKKKKKLFFPVLFAVKLLGMFEAAQISGLLFRSNTCNIDKHCLSGCWECFYYPMPL